VQVARAVGGGVERVEAAMSVNIARPVGTDPERATGQAGRRQIARSLDAGAHQRGCADSHGGTVAPQVKRRVRVTLIYDESA
jgi:hypothetical protein